MLDSVKIIARNLLPKRYQVPSKYWFNRLRGTLEKEMQLLGLVVKKYDHVIDVGGNRGVYTYQLWKLGARVVVFEPNPSCSCVLTAWGADKGEVTVHSTALSSRTGTAQLHIPQDGSGVEHDASASIENVEFELSRDQSVSLQTLDSYHIEDASFIKIDVEGHEYSVIEGAAETVATSKPALLVEIEQRHHSRPISEVFDKILGFGYQGYFLGDEGLITLENFEVVRDQTIENFGNSKRPYINNFLFLHQDRLRKGEYDVLIKGRMLQ